MPERWCLSRALKRAGQSAATVTARQTQKYSQAPTSLARRLVNPGPVRSPASPWNIRISLFAATDGRARSGPARGRNDRRSAKSGSMLNRGLNRRRYVAIGSPDRKLVARQQDANGRIKRCCDPGAACDTSSKAIPPACTKVVPVHRIRWTTGRNRIGSLVRQKDVQTKGSRRRFPGLQG